MKVNMDLLFWSKLLATFLFFHWTAAAAITTSSSSLTTSITSSWTSLPASVTSLLPICDAQNCGGDSCGPTSTIPQSSMEVISSVSSAPISTLSVISMPTNSWDVLSSGTINTASAAETSSSLEERALPDWRDWGSAANYISYLSAKMPGAYWVYQGQSAPGITATGRFWHYPNVPGHGQVGVKGLYGCTSVFVVSERGVYASHIWEGPTFIDSNRQLTDEDWFWKNSFEVLRDGTAADPMTPPLTRLTSESGPLNARYNPFIFIATPFTTEWEAYYLGVNTRLRYEERAQKLKRWLPTIVPGAVAYIVPYTRYPPDIATDPTGPKGRVILEVDSLQEMVQGTVNPPLCRLRVGQWRLWAEDRLVTFQDFYGPRYYDIMERDDSEEPICELVAPSTTSSSPSATPTPDEDDCDDEEDEL